MLFNPHLRYMLALAILLIHTQSFAEIRIMPLGDSITKGAESYNFTNDGFSASTYRLYNDEIPNDLRSYREHLHDLLTQTSCDAKLTWVGSELLSDRTPAKHEGHGGWRADHILREIPTWLLQYQPDVLLLNIGTNDLLHGQSPTEIIVDITGILDSVDEYEMASNTQVMVYIGNMVPIVGWHATHDRNHNIADTEVRRSVLTENIKTLVLSRQSIGDEIELVDINSDFYIDESDTYDCVTKRPGNPANMMMTRCQAHQPPNSPDGIHPNLLGDKFIAKQFFNALKRTSSICEADTGRAFSPTTSFTLPYIDDAIVSETFTFYGSAFDKSNSEIENVYIYIRDRNQKIWHTIADSAELVESSGASVDWAYNAYMPQGKYTVFVKAVNKEGIASARFGRRLSTQPDDRAPLTEISFPNEHSIVTLQHLTITGTASDLGGSGVKEVLVYVRNRDQKSWDTIGAHATLTNATINNSSWSYNTVLSPGNYTVFVKAIDMEENFSTLSTRKFQVQ